jgi:exosortase
MSNSDQIDDGVLEEFRVEFMGCWQRLPNKAFFLTLLAAWLALFQVLGNSTFGYVTTPSLMSAMYISYHGMANSLMESDQGFAVLVPLIVLGFYWFKRRELLALDHRVWPPALLLVVAGLMLHMLGYMVQQPLISVVGLFTGLYGLTGLAWGLAWLRASFFPFLLFGFCVPLGSLADPITLRLRLLVTQLVGLVCHTLLAIDVIADGTALRDPTNRYSYEVAAACSGIRSLIATFALAVIMAFFSFRKPWKRVIVMASAIPLAVLGNLLRMLSIVIAAEVGGQKWGNLVHDGGPGGLFSLLPYIPAFVVLLLLDRHWGDAPMPNAAPPGPAALGGTALCGDKPA